MKINIKKITLIMRKIITNSSRKWKMGDENGINE